MGIYFGEGIYGVRCVNEKNEVLYEIISQSKYASEEINYIFKTINNLPKPFDIYLYKTYSTTYELNGKLGFLWIKSDINANQQFI